MFQRLKQYKLHLSNECSENSPMMHLISGRGQTEDDLFLGLGDDEYYERSSCLLWIYPEQVLRRRTTLCFYSEILILSHMAPVVEAKL